MRWLSVAIVTTSLFGGACDGDRRTPAPSDAGDGARAADVGGDVGEDGQQGDRAGAGDAEPPACLMESQQGQPCEPVDARCGYLGCGVLSCVCQQTGWQCMRPLCP
jgi:hypothetical protein